MARVSKLRKLPTEVQDGVAELLAGGNTIDCILDYIHDAGFEWVNRSAVGRYTKALRPSIEKVRESRAIAAVVVKKLGDTSGDVGRANVDLLQSIIMKISEDIMGNGDMSVTKIMQLAIAVEKLSKSQKNSVEALSAAREEGAKQALLTAKKTIKKQSKGMGLSVEALRQINDVLGN